VTPVRHFGPFEDELKLTADDTFLGVGSDAFPDHPMTVAHRFTTGISRRRYRRKQLHCNGC